MTRGTEISVIVCLVACVLLVVAEFRGRTMARAIFKTLASSAFIMVAIQLNASTSSNGRWILTALALSWLGDIFLLSRQSRLFLLGIASFLMAHVVFSIAFAQRPLNEPALIAGFAAMACLGIIVIKWLWRHLTDFYRVAVTAYLMAIMAMCSFAIAASVASGNWILALSALAFAVSDISVARDRFVAPGFMNRAWGLPLYYAAQISFALSIGGDFSSAF